MNPRDDPNHPRPRPPARPGQAKTPGQVSDGDVYNIITDTVGGTINTRARDNLYQGLVILVCLILGAILGRIFYPGSALEGLILGGFLGLLVGLFGSGIFLMIFRALRHARGRHD